MKKRTLLQEERIETDVLIVGGGAGGMMAAISAADCGARVVLCEKGNIRRSGGLPGGNDHFMCYIPQIHGPAVRENFINGLSGRLVDGDRLLKILDLTFEVLLKWESWGINMKPNGHYEFTGHGWPGSSGRMGEQGKTNRMHLKFFDNQASVKLEQQVRKRGVIILNRVMITDLLTDKTGHVVGAIGISTREPKIFIINAKNVVLNKCVVAPSRLYPPPHIIGYSIAEPNTGDGIMMAYRVGADLQNAEIFWRQVSLRFSKNEGKGTWVGVLKDNENKPIAPPYLSVADVETGDRQIDNADPLDRVWALGKGPVWMDTRGISAEDERYMRLGFESQSMSDILTWMDQEKITFAKTRFEYTAQQPGCMIEIRTDANSRTNVEGLYSISPGGLSESAVGGQIAGESAARDALNMKITKLQKKNLDQVAQRKELYEEILNRDGQQFAGWREAQWAIFQTMHSYALPSLRTESTLMAGYNKLRRLRALTHRIIKASNQHDLYHCLEVLNLMDIAELVFLAVNERKESRGKGMGELGRLDYPFTNPMLNAFLVVTKKENQPIFRWEKPRRVSR